MAKKKEIRIPVDVTGCDTAMTKLIIELDRADLTPVEETFRRNVASNIFSQLYVKYMATVSLPADDIETVEAHLKGEDVSDKEIKPRKPRGKKV